MQHRQQSRPSSVVLPRGPEGQVKSSVTLQVWFLPSAVLDDKLIPCPAFC